MFYAIFGGECTQHEIVKNHVIKNINDPPNLYFEKSSIKSTLRAERKESPSFHSLGEEIKPSAILVYYLTKREKIYKIIL